MGRDLKGRKCGKGISQRKDKKYTARFCAKNGKRREKHFDTLPEARNWLADVFNDNGGRMVPILDGKSDSRFST